MKQPKVADHDTLCWYCKKAVPMSRDKKTGCNWTDYRTPVGGWKAKSVLLPYWRKSEKDRYMQSYKVHKCPLFERG